MSQHARESAPATVLHSISTYSVNPVEESWLSRAVLLFPDRILQVGKSHTLSHSAILLLSWQCKLIGVKVHLTVAGLVPNMEYVNPDSHD